MGGRGAARLPIRGQGPARRVVPGTGRPRPRSRPPSSGSQLRTDGSASGWGRSCTACRASVQRDDGRLVAAPRGVAGGRAAGRSSSSIHRGTSTRSSARSATPARRCARPSSTRRRRPPSIRRDRRPFLYLRLRRHDYDEAAIAAWADRLVPFLDGRPRRLRVLPARRGRAWPGARPRARRLRWPAGRGRAPSEASRPRYPRPGRRRRAARSSSAMSWKRCGTVAPTNTTEPARTSRTSSPTVTRPRPADDVVHLVLGVRLLAVDSRRPAARTARR